MSGKELPQMTLLTARGDLSQEYERNLLTTSATFPEFGGSNGKARKYMKAKEMEGAGVS